MRFSNLWYEFGYKYQHLYFVDRQGKVFLIHPKFDHFMSIVFTPEVIETNLEKPIGTLLPEFELDDKGSMPIVMIYDVDGKYEAAVYQEMNGKLFPLTNIPEGKVVDADIFIPAYEKNGVKTQMYTSLSQGTVGYLCQLLK